MMAVAKAFDQDKHTSQSVTVMANWRMFVEAARDELDRRAAAQE
jgi:hypothetical protein